MFTNKANLNEQVPGPIATILLRTKNTATGALVALDAIEIVLQKKLEILVLGQDKDVAFISSA